MVELLEDREGEISSQIDLVRLVQDCLTVITKSKRMMYGGDYGMSDDRELYS